LLDLMPSSSANANGQIAIGSRVGGERLPKYLAVATAEVPRLLV